MIQKNVNELFLKAFNQELTSQNSVVKQGIYIQQLVRWTQDALKGARESLVRKHKKTKQHDPEKEYLKQEVIHLKDLLLEHTKEISVLKKIQISYEISR